MGQNTTNPTICAIIVAAGKGARMGTAESKQYLALGDKPLLAHAVDAFERTAAVGAVVIVAGASDLERVRGYAAMYGWRKLRAVVIGGADRQHSVLAGLRALPPEAEWVLVHDAARPFATPSLIESCLAGARETGAAVLAVPVKDTIKRADAAGFVAETPPRDALWAVQTPQAFAVQPLLRAHEEAAAAGFIGTDDAMLAERAGMRVKLVMGSYRNLKITTPEDLAWARSAGPAGAPEGTEESANAAAYKAAAYGYDGSGEGGGA